jgi:organic hydroperoxide reductase OsmC/OhrA
MNLEHHFAIGIEWAGNRGSGTSDYRSYGRETVITGDGKQQIEGSSDRIFHGNAERWNPEELLLAALAECHLLSYLHVAASNGIVVTAYTDATTGTMRQTEGGGGHFTSATIRPRVTISSGDPDLALALHAEAAKKCFIAASVNFPLAHEPEIIVVP